jgi:hypothetical protein
MEEKVAKNVVGSKPLKYACRGLEEDRKGTIPPTLGGTRNQDGKHHEKYGIISLVCSIARK